MNRMPIVRFSKKDYIEQLQKGNLFLRHNMYYQRLEAADIARSDPYDGSLPFSDDGILSRIFGKELKNTRIMKLDAYVSCYYHYHCFDHGFYIPQEDKKDILDFNSDSALVIDIEKYEERLLNVCQQKKIAFCCSDVYYYNDSEQQKMNNSIKCGHIPEILRFPQFLKSDSFKNQNEYRVSVTHKPNVLIQNPNVDILDQNGEEAKALYESTLILEIGSIEEFSTMYSAEEILNSHKKY